MGRLYGPALDYHFLDLSLAFQYDSVLHSISYVCYCCKIFILQKEDIWMIVGFLWLKTILVKGARVIWGLFCNQTGARSLSTGIMFVSGFYLGHTTTMLAAATEDFLDG